MWLAETMDTPAERVRILEACLQFNPTSQAARKALQAQNSAADTAPNASLPAGRRQHIDPFLGSAADLQGAMALTDAPPLKIHSSFQSTPARTATAGRKPVSRELWMLFIGFWVLMCLGLAAVGISLMNKRPVGTTVTIRLDPIPDPIQTLLTEGELPPITRQDWWYTWTLIPRARYQITARVLSVAPYYADIRARLAPYDFALAWGDLSNPQVDQWIDWSQSGRWYYYRWEEDSPYEQPYIGEHSSNHHVVPATKNIRSALGLVKTDQIILMEGLLVDTRTNLFGSDYFANTSVSRSDIGDGACEILYIERLIVDGKEYR
jgi:hypothetical protein